MSKEGKRARLIRALRRLDPDKEQALAKTKADAEVLRQQRDLLWRLLVGAMSTLGNSRGYKKMFGAPGLYREVSFAVLEGLTEAGREKKLERTLSRATVLWSRKKAVWLNRNFERIQELGGVHRANQQALALPDRTAKMQFMRQFSGIGEKYARDVWMDIHDPHFRDTIALDVNVKKITAALGYSFGSYEEEERFFRKIAQKAERELWEADRLLYQFNDDFLRVISGKAAGGPTNRCGRRHGAAPS